MFNYIIKKLSATEINKILIQFDPYSDKPYSFRDNEELKAWPLKLSRFASVITCYDKNKIVACMFFYSNDIAVLNDEGYVVFFCVLPEYRKNGIASNILRLAKLQLKEKGISKLKLRCAKSNIEAYGLYTKNGFSVIDEDEEHYMLITQTSINARVAEEKDR